MSGYPEGRPPDMGVNIRIDGRGDPAEWTCRTCGKRFGAAVVGRDGPELFWRADLPEACLDRPLCGARAIELGLAQIADDVVMRRIP